MKPIGIIQSEFVEKFGIPKQPGLAPSLKATLVLQGEWAHETCWRGLEECSHVWVIFLFHQSEQFKGGTVRPPVLGGTKRMGVFSTRSPHRPNPLGLSLVKVGAISSQGKEAHIEVFGHDFLDGTPILDIKPYVASYDAPLGEVRHWTDGVEQKQWTVKWSDRAQVPIELRGPIEEVLRLDPRPRSGKSQESYGMAFAGYNIVFREEQDVMIVEEASLMETSSRIKD